MDMKALAKSKRAHSLHHSKKHHPHQASKAPSAGSGDKKPTKPTGKQAKERPAQSHGPKPLPSNWDRYDADMDLGSEDATVSSSQQTEFIVPKSKGADYAYLVSEAKAQPQPDDSSDISTLFNDVIHDFSQDFGPMLAARGQSMLSWIADDGFEIEDKGSTSLEAHFLSLNLDVLADQLAKAKLSDRLFLEPDVLPPELLDDELQAHGEDKHAPQTCTSAGTIDSRASTSLVYNQETIQNDQLLDTSVSSTVAVTRNFPVQTSEQGSNTIKQIKDEISLSQGTDRSFSSTSVSRLSVDPISQNPPMFEAVTAEAELDMLLNSFNETKSLSASSTVIPSAAAAENVTKGTHNMTRPANIDDDIDKLLEETSNLSKIDVTRPSHEVKPPLGDISSSMQNPSSKSKLLDDFDSWLDTI